LKKDKLTDKEKLKLMNDMRKLIDDYDSYMFKQMENKDDYL